MNGNIQLNYNDMPLFFVHLMSLKSVELSCETYKFPSIIGILVFSQPLHSQTWQYNLDYNSAYNVVIDCVLMKKIDFCMVDICLWVIFEMLITLWMN